MPELHSNEVWTASAEDGVRKERVTFEDGSSKVYPIWKAGTL